MTVIAQIEPFIGGSLVITFSPFLGFAASVCVNAELAAVIFLLRMSFDLQRKLRYRALTRQEQEDRLKSIEERVVTSNPVAALGQTLAVLTEPEFDVFVHGGGLPPAHALKQRLIRQRASAAARALALECALIVPLMAPIKRPAERRIKSGASSLPQYGQQISYPSNETI